MKRYHYGQTLKKYRELRGWTQAKLAEQWPKKSDPDGKGVNTRYVQDIEYGIKYIGDPDVLRDLSTLLAIPLWEFGLCEYNPFHPETRPGHRTAMYPEMLDLVEDHIRQIWSLRCAARIADAERGTDNLKRLFSYFNRHLPPPAQLEQRFQLLSAQVERLYAVAALERKHYTLARTTYEQMVHAVKDLRNPAATAIGLMEWGKELERKGDKHAAITLLEEARDHSLSASKRTIAFVHSYLARVYASDSDTLRFERAITTGLTLARTLPEPSGEEENDFVYSWAPVSAMLAEQSWGYVKLRQPYKILRLKEEIEQAIERDQDTRLHAWIPLDWAHAYLQLHEPEEGIKAAREFYTRVTAMQSPHALSQVGLYLRDVEAAGYAQVHAVQAFREELCSLVGENTSDL